MGTVIIKAAASVFICCILYQSLDIGTGMPFYSAIAAVICTQPEIQYSFRVGLNRTVGTLIGGFCGMGLLLLLRAVDMDQQSVQAYIFISLMIIVLMYLAEIIKRPNMFRIWWRFRSTHLLAITPLKYITDFMRKSALTNITCVAFLSVTITHGEDILITEFALNRMTDTLVGVFVSFIINIIPLRFSFRKDAEQAPQGHCIQSDRRIQRRRNINRRRMFWAQSSNASRNNNTNDQNRD